MTDNTPIRVRVSMLVECAPDRAFDAFVLPKMLIRFWLSAASGPLEVGETVNWSFMVPGAEAGTTARALERGRHIAWDWDDGSNVSIDFEPMDDCTAITVVQTGFEGSAREQADSALNGTEGFCVVLCDLKTLLETGSSAGLTRAKAKLIEKRSGGDPA